MKRPGFLNDYSGFGQTSTPTITNISFTPTVDSTGTTIINFSADVVNNSNQTLQTGSPPPGTMYNEGESFYTRNFQPVTGQFRVGVDFDGNSTGTDHPYRWGLGKPLAPGQTCTVTGSIKVANASSKNYWAGLVSEWVGWQQDNQGKQFVTVAAPVTPVSAPAVSTAPASTVAPTPVIDQTTGLPTGAVIDPTSGLVIPAAPTTTSTVTYAVLGIAGLAALAILVKVL